MVKLIELPDFIERRREYTIATDFFEGSPQQLNADAYEIAELAAGADLASVVFMTAARAIYVHDIGILPTTAANVLPTSGTGNACVVNITTDGTTEMLTKNYNNNTSIPWPAIDVYQSLYTGGTDTNRYVAAGGHLEVAVTQEANSNISVTNVTVTYADADAYPVPGFGVLAADGGTAVITNDGVKRIFVMTTQATDNDQMYLFSTGESFKFLADKPFVAECLIQYTEADTSDDFEMNLIFGLMNAVAADHLQDDGAGPPANYSGAVIFKVDGETLWKFESSVGATQVPATGNGTASTITAGTAALYQRLRIEWVPTTTTGNQINFFVDGVQIGSNIQTLTSATEMQLVLGIKAGSANIQTLNCDYIGCSQAR